jgi:gluconolactonase
VSADPYEILDRRFESLVDTSARLSLLDATSRWAEGPVYVPAGRYLLWSDIPNDRMMRWDEASGHVSVFRVPAQNSNGNTLDRQGRLVTCEHLTRRVTRTEHDGSITVIADRIEGKRFNSPNDVIVGSDGAIWFTDPTYGIDSDDEGRRAESEVGRSRLYRVDPSDGSVSVAADDFIQPNGLAFSVDERQLFVSDTGRTHIAGGPAHIRVFDVDAGRLTGGEVFAECTAGLFDGFRVDEAGNLWTSAGDGVHCYEPGGALIGTIHVPDPVANVCFGGPARNLLFICATGSVYSLSLKTNGIKLFEGRPADSGAAPTREAPARR